MTFMKEKEITFTEEEEVGVLQQLTDFICNQFDSESTALFATARIWDDGIIDPRKSREVLALSLKASLNTPIGDTKFGNFRM